MDSLHELRGIAPFFTLAYGYAVSSKSPLDFDFDRHVLDELRLLRRIVASVEEVEDTEDQPIVFPSEAVEYLRDTTASWKVGGQWGASFFARAVPA